MKDFRRIISTLFIFSLSIFFIVQSGLSQKTWKERREERRERLKEKIRENVIEKKREATKPTQQLPPIAVTAALIKNIKIFGNF